MVKRRTAHLFIGFLRKTVLFPCTELPRLRGSRGFFWALGAVILERRPRMRMRYHGLSHIGSG